MANNEDLIDRKSSHSCSQSNKTSEISKKESEANSSDQLSDISKKKDIIMNYEKNQKGVMDIVNILDEKYGSKKEKGEKKEETTKEEIKENQKNKEEIQKVYRLFCKKEGEKNLKEQLLCHYKIEKEYMDIFNEYKNIIKDERNNFFDDHIFEEKCVQLLKEKYNFTDFDAFPLFKKIRSIYKNEVTILDYYEVTLTVLGEIKKFFFLDDNSGYLPINFEKNEFRFLTLIERDMNRNIDIVNFYFPDYNFVIEKDIKDKDNNKNTKKKEGFNSIIMPLYESELTEKNSDIKACIERLKKEIMNSSKEEFKKNDNKGNEQILNEIINLKIDKRNQEFDGFFITKSETYIQNFKLPGGSFVLVEVKNNDNCPKIKRNIMKKIYLLFSLGINIDNFFFLGILKAINEKEVYKDKIKIVKYNDENKKSSEGGKKVYTMKNFYEEHVLILSSKELINEKEKLYEKQKGNEISNLELFKNLSNQIEKVKNEIKYEMDKIKDDIKEIKDRMNNIEDDNKLLKLQKPKLK